MRLAVVAGRPPELQVILDSEAVWFVTLPAAGAILRVRVPACDTKLGTEGRREDACVARLDVGDNLGIAVCAAEFVTGEVEDTEEVGDTGDSGGLEGAGNRIPTTEPGLRNITGCTLGWAPVARNCCRGTS